MSLEDKVATKSEQVMFMDSVVWDMAA
uniref:Uncharacterized protein n=1 Tax=Arundo donax TaxID=35708 RepID=A0A0A9A936_ARUDO